ncbi:Phosphoenolpyruvate/pyruvate domain-containing protein [Hyaloscypha variabilis F]|uniref:Phosphoenolpyruvate/pyruvate domain-containing protein n=1 Tax=Hyaloscypha variabilis (strain UAMH 11265 / GT02V1 / F) TaxID=1149755 RepID=A0A2J6S3W8_HYAVF|nr:Phosphoenolpyruvate/pyruvate domain-containing protein [Hyaloscypha variabilis F]
MATETAPVFNEVALLFKSLHKPGDPLVLTNIYDEASTNAVISLNETTPHLVKALATTSYGIANTFSVPDGSLTFNQNLAAIQKIAPLARSANLPLTVDLQDGYGEFLEQCVHRIIYAGAVGANIEDSYSEKDFSDGMDSLRSVEESAERIRLSIKYAADIGLPDFVVNARTDVMRLEPIPEGWTREMMIQESVKRGKAFLDAGATCVFVWGRGVGQITKEEVKLLVKEFEGRLAVKLPTGNGRLSVKELAGLGVCRISIGPSLYGKDMHALRNKAERILMGDHHWNEGD